MRTLSDQALPATFLPLDMLWPERAKKRGTYDKTWMETRFPGLPDDFDWSFFNVAAEDQQAPQPFAGDELLRLEGAFTGTTGVLPALVPAGGELRTGQDGAAGLVLQHLSAPLAGVATVPVTLVFDRSGAVTVDVPLGG